MREQPHYTNLLTADFFKKHHIEERKSMAEISRILRRQDPPFNITVATLCKYCDRVGIERRLASEAKRNWDPDPLNWNVSHENEKLIEAIDGFVLGDGSIGITNNSKAGRCSCAQEHQEFTMYEMSFFESYKPIFFKANHKKSKNRSAGIFWHGQTKYHPDFYKHYIRWYPLAMKEPPLDIRITPTSVMLWYLGDGCVVESGNSIAIRLSTDSFTKEGVEFLAKKLEEKGIQAHRNGDNRVYIEARGIPAFFDFIGKASPVKCYEYKFKLPEWRLESKRMRDVAEELEIDYDRLAYLVKIGKVEVYRASENGKPRFMPEHIAALKKMIKSGKFDKDGRK